MLQSDFLLNVIEKNIREWLAKNPRLLYSIRGDHSASYKDNASRNFMMFLRECPRHKLHLKQIGIVDEGLTDAGYIFLRRIAEGLNVN